ARGGGPLLGTFARAGAEQRDRAHQPRVRQAGLPVTTERTGTTADAGDFLELTRKISTERGFGCANYKEKCLRRRIAVRMRARVDVLGTDIDRRSLADAVAGQFEEADFADTPDDTRARYYTAFPPFTVLPAIRQMVRYERRDLLADGPPPGRFDLIVCRNVLI